MSWCAARMPVPSRLYRRRSTRRHDISSDGFDRCACDATPRNRGIPMLFVVNRLPTKPDEQAAIMNDISQRLHSRELLAEADASLLFGIEEGEVDPRTEALHPNTVAAIRKELSEVADPVYRSGLVTKPHTPPLAWLQSAPERSLDRWRPSSQ